MGGGGSGILGRGVGALGGGRMWGGCGGWGAGLVKVVGVECVDVD